MVGREDDVPLCEDRERRRVGDGAGAAHGGHGLGACGAHRVGGLLALGDEDGAGRVVGRHELRTIEGQAARGDAAETRTPGGVQPEEGLRPVRRVEAPVECGEDSGAIADLVVGVHRRLTPERYRGLVVLGREEVGELVAEGSHDILGPTARPTEQQDPSVIAETPVEARRIVLVRRAARPPTAVRSPLRTRQALERVEDGRGTPHRGSALARGIGQV